LISARVKRHSEAGRPGLPPRRHGKRSLSDFQAQVDMIGDQGPFPIGPPALALHGVKPVEDCIMEMF
jgi:hypothetical protein